MKKLYSKLITEYKKLRAVEKKYNDQKKVVESLKADMLHQMHAVGTDTYKGARGTVSAAHYQVPIVDDWNKLYKYIYKNKAFDLLQRRVTSTAWHDRVEDAKKPIPGIKPMTQSRLRINVK